MFRKFAEFLLCIFYGIETTITNPAAVMLICFIAAILIIWLFMVVGFGLVFYYQKRKESS